MERRYSRRRPPRRLDIEAYARSGAICSVTIATRNRVRIFADSQIATATVNVLHKHAVERGIRVYAYCVMPDHVHLVIEPSPTCDIVTFVGQFKNLAQRAAWQHGTQGRIWQESFWDHFLRADEQLEQVVAYVLNNLVRQGLVKDRRNYPFAGSLEMEL